MLIRLALLLITILLSACASVHFSDYRQPVRVLSEPYGVKVYDGRGKYLGITPGFIGVRRSRSPELRFVAKDGKAKTVQLDTRYRWTDSFWMNFLFLTYAPIGWLVDVATGTAWHIEDPELLRFGPPSPHLPPRLIAVAPPIVDEMDVADGLGVVIENKLRASGKWKVLNYVDTAAAFQYYESERGLTPNSEDRYNLLYELKSDYVFLSKAEPSGDSFIVKGELKSPITGHVASEYRWEVTPVDGAIKDSLSTRRLFANSFHLLPNTIFLSFANYSPAMNIEGREYGGKEAATHGFIDEASKYLSSISIANLERPRPNVRGHWTFDFIPNLLLSKKNIVFKEYAPLEEVEFSRWYLSGGYGIETGYLSRFGFLYLDIIPALTYTRLDYQTTQVSGSLARWSIQTTLEVGYTYFFSDHFVGRLFARTLNEDAPLWNEAFSHATGVRTNSDTVTSGIAGFSLGWYIPSTLTRREGWKVRSR